MRGIEPQDTLFQRQTERMVRKALAGTVDN
jgi:hypothetical protein